MRSLVWNITFSNFLVPEFTKKQLIDFVSKELEHTRFRTTEGSVEREVDVCLRTYVPARPRSGQTAEDNLDCPLAELELIHFISEDNFYRFNIGPKPSLAPKVFGYALFTFFSHVLQKRRSISLEECIYQFGSPGQIFKLDENSAVDYLELMEELTGGRIRLIETAGLRQLYISEGTNDFFAAGMDLLQSYYEN